MSAESPIFDAYRDLVTQARNYAFLSRVDDQFEVDTEPLITAVQVAHEVGLNQEAIMAAIREGELKGTLEIVEPNEQIETAEYWDEVRAEAEAFWAKRYDPDAAEDW